MSDKIWRVGDNFYTDKEVIRMIKDGKLKAADILFSKEIEEGIMIKESIYQFYLKEEIENETI